MADSTLKTRIQDDVKAAMRSKDKDRLGTLRLITARTIARIMIG